MSHRVRPRDRDLDSDGDKPPSTVASTRLGLLRRRPETDAEQVTCRSGGALHLGDRSGRDLFTTLSATLVRLRSAAVAASASRSPLAAAGSVRACSPAAAAAAAPVGRQIQLALHDQACDQPCRT